MTTKRPGEPQGEAPAWFIAALRTPSRAAVLLLAVQALVVVAVVGDRVPDGGLYEVSQFAGGLAILFVIVTWRRFWMGPAVVRTRARQLGVEP